MRLNKFFQIFFLLTTLVFTYSCASKNIQLKEAAPSQTQMPGDVVILATTDYHSTLDKAESTANEIKKIREKYGNRILHLDGGDLFQGSLEGNLSKGKAMIEFYNEIGVDASAMGNHELDYGPDVASRNNVLKNEDGLGSLKRRYREAKFKWLSANFIKTNAPSCNPQKDINCNAMGEETLFLPRTIFEKNGFRSCVIGATTPTTPQITNSLFIRGMKFNPLLETVRSEVSFLKTYEKCDFIFLTVHAGLVCDKSEHCKEPGDFAEILNLLNQLPYHFIDGIVAGHTHQKAREIINGVPVLEAGSYARVLGVMHIYKNPTIESRFEDWIPIPDKFNENQTTQTISKLMKSYREKAHVIKSRKVGYATETFHQNYHSETALGNLITDAVLTESRKKSDVDFVLMNSGGLRNDFQKGLITYGDIFKVLPFDNSLTIIDFTGAELRQLLEIAYSGSNGMPPSSGLKIRRYDVKASDNGPWNRDINGDGKYETWERNLIVNLEDSQGKPIESNSIYQVATIDFLVQGAEHQDTVYTKLHQDRIHKYTGVWIRDLFENYLKKLKTVSPSHYYDPNNPRIQLIPFKN